MRTANNQTNSQAIRTFNKACDETARHRLQFVQFPAAIWKQVKVTQSTSINTLCIHNHASSNQVRRPQSHFEFAS
jgi:hypothetical protein